jgi:hypothetical protein
VIPSPLSNRPRPRRRPRFLPLQQSTGSILRFRSLSPRRPVYLKIIRDRGLGSPELGPELQKKIVDGVVEEVDGRSFESLSQERDELILGLLEMRRFCCCEHS